MAQGNVNNYNYITSTNVLWIRNWRTLLHIRRADAAHALTRWWHFSAWNDNGRYFEIM